MYSEKIKSAIRILAIILVIVLIIYILNLNQEKTNIIYSRLSDISEIEELKKENENYQDEIGHLESQLEELQKDYEEAEDLIHILREQLEDYGIEPYEL